MLQAAVPIVKAHACGHAFLRLQRNFFGLCPTPPTSVLITLQTSPFKDPSTLSLKTFRGAAANIRARKVRLQKIALLAKFKLLNRMRSACNATPFVVAVLHLSQYHSPEV